jgi:hypothetical protein
LTRGVKLDSQIALKVPIMKYEFSIIVDSNDPAEHFPLSEGLNVHQLTEIISALSKAIDADKSDLVLLSVEDKCGKYNFGTSSEDVEYNFQHTVRTLSIGDPDILSEAEAKFSKSIDAVIKPGWHLRGEDKEGNIIGKIEPKQSLSKRRPTILESTIYGELWTLGKTIKKVKDGIVVRDNMGVKHTIEVSKDQLAGLKSHFRAEKIRFDVKGRISEKGLLYDLILSSYFIPKRTLLESIDLIASSGLSPFEEDDDPVARLIKDRSNAN